MLREMSFIDLIFFGILVQVLISNMHYSMKKVFQKGFTLLEIVLTVVAILILAGIVILAIKK